MTINKISVKNLAWYKYLLYLCKVKKRAEDIAPMLAEMTEHLRSLRETVNSQHEQICALNRNIERQNRELRKLRKENGELREKLGSPAKPCVSSHPKGDQ